MLWKIVYSLGDGLHDWVVLQSFEVNGHFIIGPDQNGATTWIDATRVVRIDPVKLPH